MAELRAYQELARDFLRNQPRGAGLFLDMSLGKTAISLAALEPRHLPALVVAPKRVTERVWPVEAPKWRPDLSFAAAVGSPSDRQAAFAARADVTAVSRDNLGDAQPDYRTVILDETSSFKDRSTVRWRRARKLCSKADYVWGLTGTPSPNGLLDLWAQVFLLDGGERLGKTLGGYRERFFLAGARLPNGTITEWIIRDEAEDKIHELLEGLCLYMSADDELDLPPTVENIVEIPLPAKVLRYYQEIKETLVLDMELIGGDIYTAANQAVLSNKLRQIAGGFIFSDEQDGTYTRLHSLKLDALEEIRDGTGDNLLVFYNYKPELEMIRERFPHARMIDERGALDAWDRAELPMMLAHPASAAHGLNLQFGGHTAVWYSLTWDLELYLQANGRLPRPGQEHTVIIHKLLCPNTVDFTMDSRLGGKETTQNNFLSHIRNPI